MNLKENVGRLAVVALALGTPMATIACDDTSTTAGGTVDAGSPGPFTGSPEPTPGNPVDDPSAICVAGPVASDAQIALVMLALNAGEMAQGELARATTTRDEVKAFADEMVAGHTSALRRGASVAPRLGEPLESETSRQIGREVHALLLELGASTSDAFDAAYVGGQVKMHARALEVLDGELLPRAKDAALLEDLRTARGEIAAHLERARRLAAGVGDRPGQ